MNRLGIEGMTSIKKVVRDNKLWSVYFFSIFLIFSFLLNTHALSLFKDFEKHYLLYFFLGIVYFIYFAINILLALSLFKANTVKQEAERQRLINESLEETNRELEAIKQEFDHSIKVIYDLAVNAKHEELKELINNTNSETIVSSIANIYMCEAIKNAGIAGLIIRKLELMKNNGIDIKFIVHDEIHDVDMKTHHLCEVLGIILDNAIEAAASSKERFIRFLISKDDRMISFLVENSCNNEFKAAKAFGLGWSTKGSDRGMGLWIAKNTIKRYKNVNLNVQVDGTRVTQTLVILS